MGRKNRIRPIALCLLRREEAILVNEGYDSVKQMAFVRPLGGGIDFGETSAEAVVREIREELGADITDVTLLGVVESIFDFDGSPYHELVFVYDGRFADGALYEQEGLTGVEGKRQFTATWRSVADLQSGPLQLVPEPLWELL
ncbi:MAG: NUDIX hydrolase [Nodosilinea sp.]